jgi:serine/threonine protein kinase
MSVNNFYRNISKDKEIDKNYQRLYYKYKKKYLNLKQKGSSSLNEKEGLGAAEQSPQGAAEQSPQGAAEQSPQGAAVLRQERSKLSRQSSLKNIEENNIQDCSKDLKDNCFTVDGTILFEGKNFRNVNIIKQGSYGTVTIYQSDDEKKIAIKTFENPIDYYKEKLISKIIAEKQIELKNILQIVPSYWYEKGDDRKIIMHGKDGDLEKIAGEISSDLNKNLTEAKSYFIDTVESIKKLWENGLYFCDLKLGNVLYSEIPEKKIYLADIGGVVFFDQIVNMDFFKSIIGFDLIIINKYFGLIDKTNEKIYLFGIVDKSNWHKNIEPDSNILEKEINGKTGYIIKNDDKLNGYITLSSHEGIFTYPLTTGGIVQLIVEDQNKMKLELLNNIFYSIIVFLFNLLFNNFFSFDHNSSNETNYIKNSVKEVNRKIDESGLIGLKNLKKLTKYLLKQSKNRDKFLNIDVEENEENEESNDIGKKFDDIDIGKKFDDIISLVENIDKYE